MSNILPEFYPENPIVHDPLLPSTAAIFMYELIVVLPVPDQSIQIFDLSLIVLILFENCQPFPLSGAISLSRASRIKKAGANFLTLPPTLIQLRYLFSRYTQGPRSINYLSIIVLNLEYLFLRSRNNLPCAQAGGRGGCCTFAVKE